MAIVGGPFRDFKWGGLTLTPVKDSDAEWKKSGFEYEHDMSPNEKVYSTQNSVVGYVQQECVMTPDEYAEYQEYQDGESRSGVATAPNGSVITIDGAIDGEMVLAGGKVTVKLAGKVRVQ